MARYLEIAGDLRKEVEACLNGVKQLIENAIETHPEDVTTEECFKQPIQDLAVKIGHMINLSIRACPRGVQHTVRLNIVKEAVGRYCRVTMTEEMDERTQRTYHKIHIEPRS